MRAIVFVAVAPADRLRPSAGAMKEFGAAHDAVIPGPGLSWKRPLIWKAHGSVWEAEILKSGRYGVSVRQNCAWGLSIVSDAQVSRRRCCILMPVLTNVPPTSRMLALTSTPWYRLTTSPKLRAKVV